MPIENQIATHLNIRIDPKLRYLTEIAARARRMSLTEYIEDALRESFKRVSLDEFPELGDEPEVYELSPAQRQERFKKRRETVSNPLSEVGDKLWSEHPFVRIQMLMAFGFDHLLSDEDRRIWRHVFARYAKDGKLKTKSVIENWDRIRFEIWHDGLNAKDKAAQVKAKAGK